MWSRGRQLAGVGCVVAVALMAAGCHLTSSTAEASPAATASAATSAATLAGTAGPVLALGDSYTAGALLPIDVTASPPGCLRSTKAYPFLVATALHAQLTDVACTNAGVNMMTSEQKTYLGTNPAQLGAVKADDKVVLLSLGGDDLGFLNVLQECMKLAIAPAGSPCQQHYTVNGADQLAGGIQTEQPKVEAVLTEIRQRAPQARVVLVGYPDMFPQSGGCWPAVPITNGDVAYLRGTEVKINAMEAAAASATGVTFIDTYTPTTGHDFCQPESNRDVEGLLPGSIALPFHPNARGQQAMATAVLAALKS